jgi:hypothetical protein
MRRPLFGAFLATASVVVACSSGTTTKYIEAGPTSGTYTITFPSTAAAVATDTVQVLVFDAGTSDSGNICFELITKRKSNQQLPTPIVTTAPTTPCDLELNGAGAVTIPFGNVAVLVAAQRQGTDFLLGCAVQSLSSDNPTVNVSLTLAGAGVSVPPSTCTNLSPHCKGNC